MVDVIGDSRNHSDNGRIVAHPSPTVRRITPAEVCDSPGLMLPISQDGKCPQSRVPERSNKAVDSTTVVRLMGDYKLI